MLGRLRFGAGLAAVAFLSSLLGVGSAQATGIQNRAVKIGTFSFQSVGSGTQGASGADQGPPHQPKNERLRHTTASQVPNIAGTPLASGTGGASGFNGLDNPQQKHAGTGIYANSQFTVSPPDQGLCVGKGFVVEAVNVALRVYSTTGAPLTPPVPLNQFAGVAPESQNLGPPFGEELFDPRCYYDPGTGRWFVIFAANAVEPSTEAAGNTASLFIAVSNGSDPTKSWTIYAFSTTDDGTSGTPSDPECPCFGDQPLLGADANGVYISTNEYSLKLLRGEAAGPNGGFNGAQIYAMSKAGLESGSNTTVTQLQPGLSSSVTDTLGGVAFSIQPATSPNAGYETAANGTEYFQSALDFGAAPELGTRADRIAVWNLTKTASLKGTNPSLALHVVVLPSEEYTQPPNATQAPGTLVLNSHLPLLSANDDRMNQVVYAAGHLWSGLNTAVKTPQGPTLVGLAWFVTSPATSSSGDVSATLAGQGYLGVNQEDVLYPSIGVTPAGHAVMSFTLTGPDYHPSAAWAPLSTAAGAGPIHIAALGTNADDDYTSVKENGGDGVGRWGDYTAAVSDPSGNVWMGVEYIISGVEDGLHANWATFISHVTP